MKKYNTLLFLVALSIILAVFSFYRSGHSSQLVYVDVNKLIEGYQRTKLAKVEFEKKTKSMKANVDSLVSQWQNELKIYEQERASLSPKELQLKQELLSSKQEHLTAYQEAINNQIAEEDKKITQTVINEVNDYVREYGKENGYKIIFGASGGGNIMYADESTDLTAKVLEGLNADYEKK